MMPGRVLLLLFASILFFLACPVVGHGSSPIIEYVIPNIGKSSGGTQITVGGKNFISGKTVIKIGQHLTANVNVIRENLLTAIVPPEKLSDISEKRDITVETPNGAFIFPNGFRYFLPAFAVINQESNYVTLIYTNFTQKNIDIGACPTGIAFGNGGTFAVTAKGITLFDVDGSSKRNILRDHITCWKMIFGGDKFVVISDNPRYALTYFDWQGREEPKQLYISSSRLVDIEYGNGKFVLLDHWKDEAIILDAKNMEILKKVAIGFSPSSVAFGNGVFAIVCRDGYTNFLNPDNYQISPTPLPSGWNITFGGERFVTVGSTGYVSLLLKTDGDGTVKKINVGKRPYAIAYGDGLFAVANRDNDTVTMFNADGSGITKEIPVGKHPVSICFGDGLFAVANFKSNDVTIFNSEGVVIRQSISVGKRPSKIVFSYHSNM